MAPAVPRMRSRWGAVRPWPRVVCQQGALEARCKEGAVHPGPREACQRLVPLVGINLIGTDVYTDMVDASLEVNDGILEPVDAVVERGVSAMVLM